MTAVELLRSLDKAATAGPWSLDEDPFAGDPRSSFVGPAGEFEARYKANVDVLHPVLMGAAEGRMSDLRFAHLTRNLLPELAALVEAVRAYMDASAAESDSCTEGHAHAVIARADAYLRMIFALSDLDAKAATLAP